MVFSLPTCCRLFKPKIEARPGQIAKAHTMNDSHIFRLDEKFASSLQGRLEEIQLGLQAGLRQDLDIPPPSRQPWPVNEGMRWDPLFAGLAYLDFLKRPR